MLDRGLPFAEKATPASSATSSHRPPPRFIQSWFGEVSFVTNRSRRPSLLKSVATTPRALPGACANPVAALTSAKRPPPSLWNRKLVTGSKIRGTQK